MTYSESKKKIMGLFNKFRGVKCRLCGKNTGSKDGRVLVHARADKSMSSVIFSADEQVSMTLLNRLGLSLIRLDDIREDVYVCNDCIGAKLLPAADKYIDELKEGYLKKAKDQAQRNYYTELTGGVGEFGVPKALFSLVELYHLDKKASGEVGAYWIVKLSVKLLKDGAISWQTLEEPTKRAIHESLMKKMEFADAFRSGWSSRLSDIESLVHSGVKLENPILAKIKEWESVAANDLATGKTAGGRWASSDEAGAAYAKEVVAKAKEIYAISKDS
ncbi:MAG: hypothetical protein FJ004_08490 [Chloroflexi bacterium]|nr:hypothetical protein [Chloroflexota bacterium]MBM4401002.1 hypothetical protein [Thermoproteota archaeon]